MVERAFPDRAAALLTVVDRWLWLGTETRTGRRTQRCEACLRGKSKAAPLSLVAATIAGVVELLGHLGFGGWYRGE